MSIEDDTMEKALEYLSDRGPVFSGFLSNHGPMASEALIQLGRDEAVMPYLESYRAVLEERPALHGHIDTSTWWESLGYPDLYAAWQRFFEDRLAEQPWRDVLDTWAGRLAPGLWAELLHGLIRTGHAARSLAARDTPLRRRELAEGLALWASWYTELPHAPAAEAGLRPGDAFARLPLLPPEQRGDRRFMDDTGPDLNGVPTLIDMALPLATLSDVTETFARLYITNAGIQGNSPIILIHAVTGPAALRLLAPHVSTPTLQRLLRYAWQAAAKINASWNFVGDLAGVEAGEIDREDVIDQAVATGDEHAMKLVEACLREHSLNPAPAYLAAAKDVVHRLRG